MNDAGSIWVLFMRHGHSLGDVEGRHEGRYDAPLTEQGRAQAQARATAWQQASEPLDRIIASPLRRAWESAEIIARTLGAPLEADEQWMELDNGPLAGLTFAEAEARYPWPPFRHPYAPFFETGEGAWEGHCRAAMAVQSVVRRGPGRYLVVSHGGLLNAALRHIVGAPPPINYRGGLWFALGDTSFVRAEYRPARAEWHLHEMRP